MIHYPFQIGDKVRVIGASLVWLVVDFHKTEAVVAIKTTRGVVEQIYPYPMLEHIKGAKA